MLAVQGHTGVRFHSGTVLDAGPDLEPEHGERQKLDVSARLEFYCEEIVCSAGNAVVNHSAEGDTQAWREAAKIPSSVTR